MSEEYKKFGELTRDEQLELVNHVLDGGDVEILMEDQNKWYNAKEVNRTSLCFHATYPYRKIKTELEILKEEYEKIGKKIQELEVKSSDIKVGDHMLRIRDGLVFQAEDSGSVIYPFCLDGIKYTQAGVTANFTPFSRITINY